MKLIIETLSVHTNILICYDEDTNKFFSFKDMYDLTQKLTLCYGMIEPNLRDLFSDDDYFFLIEKEKKNEVGFGKRGVR